MRHFFADIINNKSLQIHCKHRRDEIIVFSQVHKSVWGRIEGMKGSTY